MQPLKSMRLHIGVFGRTNVGKSSILNRITNQEISIVSDIAGTTTDVVEKSMELLPIGPVTFLDTAGLDDKTELGEQRIEKTMKVLNRIDIAVIVCDYNKNELDDYEKLISRMFPQEIWDAEGLTSKVMTKADLTNLMNFLDELIRKAFKEKKENIKRYKLAIKKLEG